MIDDTNPIKITIESSRGRVLVERDQTPGVSAVYLAPTAGGSPDITSAWIECAATAHGLDTQYRPGETSVTWACRLIAELCARHCGFFPRSYGQLADYAGTKFGAASMARATVIYAP